MGGRCHLNMHSSTFWTGGHSASVQLPSVLSLIALRRVGIVLDRSLMRFWVSGGAAMGQCPPLPLLCFWIVFFLLFWGPVFCLVRDAGSGGVQEFISSPGFLHLAYVVCSLAGGLTFLYLGFFCLYYEYFLY